MNAVLVPVTAIVVIGVISSIGIYLTKDSEVVKFAITAIGSLVTGGVGGYALGVVQGKKGEPDESS